jgi:hypothetical protein
MTTFNELWHEIRQRLSQGQEISNWSYDGQARGVTRIERFNYDEVVVTGENTKEARSVSRNDFKKVFEIWDRYKQGLVPRSEIGKISRNTTYILTILHWLERPTCDG